MKVYFACSSFEIKDHLKNYRRITDEIKKLGHEIVGDWLSRVEQSAVLNDRETGLETSERLREEGIEAVKNADLLVAEVSLQSIGVGYQIAMALELKKPVLCLVSSEFGIKKPSQIIKAADSPLLVYKKYSPNNLSNELADFLKKHNRQNLIKFNFIITPEIDRYLYWKSDSGKLSKSEILRQLVVEKIIALDDEYLRWLKRSS